MIARWVAVLAVAATLAGTGIYFVVDLFRWEWSRAMIAGLAFLAAEILLATLIISSEIRKQGARSARADARTERILAQIRQAPRQRSQAFSWLADARGQQNVFVPLLMGAGVALSALAWVVERIGGATVGSGTDASLASALAHLGPPEQGFLDTSCDPLRQLRGPSRQ
ncbi:MAG: hypothetical protein FWE39_13680 [Nocardiaceae bacterium]|nr:hypothetical protein [Nocardiaceae bacterium]